MPRPAPSIPALLETMVRFLTPDSRMASIRAVGMPQSPKPAGHDHHAVFQHIGEGGFGVGVGFFHEDSRSGRGSKDDFL